MNDTLRTEEFGRKKNFKWVFFLFMIFLIIAVGTYLIYTSIINQKNKKQKKKEVEVTSLNSELQDIYGFAISDHYITALKNDGSVFNLYNLLQGTGNLGDFTYYTYHNDQLYLLFSDNSLYTISLTSGNGVYELTRNYTLDSLSCVSGNVGKTSDLAFDRSTIYVNTSSCGINRLSYDQKNKKVNIDALKIFQNVGVDFEYSKLDESLYTKADNAIYQFNMKTKEIKPIASNIVSNIPLVLKSNILIYSNIEGNTISYYGYNVKTKQNSKIAENVSDLILYKNSFLYRTNDTIYMLTGDQSKEIYKVHYNQLSNMQLIHKNILQVVDSDVNDIEKRRIINIDLASKNYQVSQNIHEFSNIVEYTKS